MRKYIPKTAKLIPEEAKKVFQGEIWEVFQWQQKMFDGSHETFEMTKRPDTVKIIPVITDEEAKTLIDHGVVKPFSESNMPHDLAHASSSNSSSPTISSNSQTDMKLLITKQEQPRKDCFYDYPGGRHDNPKETELDAAKRELLEETGLTFRNWKLIKVEQPFAKIDWLVYTFFATGLVDWTKQKLDAGEKIEVLAISFAEITKLANSSESRYLKNTFDSYDKLQALPELYTY